MVGGRDEARMVVLASSYAKQGGPFGYIQVTSPEKDVAKNTLRGLKSKSILGSYELGGSVWLMVLKGDEKTVRDLTERELENKGIEFDYRRLLKEIV